MKLSKPSKEIIKRIQADLGFNERFTGYRLHKRIGAISVDIYSFKELVNLLNDPHPRIDFDALRNWLSTVIGDGELAENIGALAAMNISEQEKSIFTRDIIEERLNQCRKKKLF